MDFKKTVWKQPELDKPSVYFVGFRSNESPLDNSLEYASEFTGFDCVGIENHVSTAISKLEKGIIKPDHCIVQASYNYDLNMVPVADAPFCNNYGLYEKRDVNYAGYPEQGLQFIIQAQKNFPNIKFAAVNPLDYHVPDKPQFNADVIYVDEDYPQPFGIIEYLRHVNTDMFEQ